MSIRATANSILPQPGFRLHRLEVRNWGTFDGKIHILDPLGKTALLIGENGSGKSTLVDALLTLLVPRTKRNYNMSAGAAKKRERDERTYVLGAYGSESGSEESRAQIKFLRKKPGSPPTILLACFLNDATGEAVSLGQMLWVQDDDVRKLFLIARSARSIKGDFSGLQESKSWKKALKRSGFEVEESFNDYAEKAVRYLKMESTTTLALFSQTVAIKEITHVSTFIRDHMLERLDTRELMERLEQHYEDLTKCWDAIQRARRQLELLQPVPVAPSPSRRRPLRFSNRALVTGLHGAGPQKRRASVCGSAAGRLRSGCDSLCVPLRPPLHFPRSPPADRSLNGIFCATFGAARLAVPAIPACERLPQPTRILSAGP